MSNAFSATFALTAVAQPNRSATIPNRIQNMKTQHAVAIVGTLASLVAFSLLARDPVPWLGEPPSQLILKSGGEVIGYLILTNRAGVHMPVGKHQVVTSVDGRSFTYRGDGALTLQIESARGQSIKVVAEEIEFLR